jgi:hypothetical protein
VPLIPEYEDTLKREAHQIGLSQLNCLAIAAGLAACAPNGDTAELAVLSDSAGIEIVTNGGDGSLGALEAHEVRRLGVVDGGGPQQFSQVHAVALGSDGQIVVGNNSSATVRVFDASGGFRAEFGGRGRGPSEVTVINDLLVAGDTVVLIDWQGGGKSVLFRLDGTFLTSWPATRPDGTRIHPLAKSPDGWLMSVNTQSRLPLLAPGEAWTATQNIHLIGFGSTELGRRVYAVAAYTLYGTGAQGEGSVDWSLFRPRTYQGFDAAGRLYLTDPLAYRIDIITESGIQRSVRRPFQPRPLTDEDVREMKAVALQAVDTSSRIPDQYRAEQRTYIAERIDRQARLPRPSIAAPLGPILVSTDGSFWVQRADTASPAQNEADEMFGAFEAGCALMAAAWIWRH